MPDNPKMFDGRVSEISIQISEDGKLWINDSDRCLVRIQGLKTVRVVDKFNANKS